MELDRDLIAQAQHFINGQNVHEVRGCSVMRDPVLDRHTGSVTRTFSETSSVRKFIYARFAAMRSICVTIQKNFVDEALDEEIVSISGMRYWHKSHVS